MVRPLALDVVSYTDTVGGGLVSFLVIAMAGSAIAFFSSTVGYIKASKAIHNQLILAVFGSTLRFGFEFSDQLGQKLILVLLLF